MIHLLRENLLLKIVSLTVAILLYVFVQADRNPRLSRTFTVVVQQENTPLDLEVTSEQRQTSVTVTGPRLLLDRLKEGDIRAMGDLSNLPTTEQKVVALSAPYQITGFSVAQRSQLSFDPPFATLRLHLYPRTTTQRRVEVLYSKDPPAGFDYSSPEVRPAKVKLVGRSDRVKLVDRLVVNAAPNEDGSIEGDFAVIPRDKDNNTVDGVMLNPEMVRVVIPLAEKPQTKTILVSPAITELPPPPYHIVRLSVSPAQVKVSGSLQRLNRITTLMTEDLSARDLRQTTELEANLIKPPDVEIRDVAGRPVNRVLVRIVIGGGPTPPLTSPPASGTGTGSSPTPTKETDS